MEPEAESIFDPVSKAVDLGSILCVKHKRKTDAVSTFSLKNRCFQIPDQDYPIIRAKREITVLMNPRYRIGVEYQGHVYDTMRYLKPQKNANKKVTKKVIKEVEPHLQMHHGSDEWKRIWWMEDYNSSLIFFIPVLAPNMHINLILLFFLLQ